MNRERLIHLLEQLESKVSNLQSNGFNITDEEIEALSEVIELLFEEK